MKTVIYYFSPISPWAYFGHERLLEMAERHGVRVEPRPCALLKEIFPGSGGLPLPKRPPQRRAYRLVELRRWAEYLELPLNVHPAYFPVDDEPAALMVTAAIQQEGPAAALRLLGAIYRAVWVNERNVADPATLLAIATDCQLDGETLMGDRETARERYRINTQLAIADQVFGAPWYIYEGQPFWGQDRLDFLERAMAAG